MCGYALLGAGWLILKTEDAPQRWARRAGRVCLIGGGVAILGVSVWTPIEHADIAARWFSWPNIAYLAPVPIITALIAYVEWRSLGREHELVPFLAAIGLFAMSFVGLAINQRPMIVPGGGAGGRAAAARGARAGRRGGARGRRPGSRGD